MHRFGRRRGWLGSPGRVVFATAPLALALAVVAAAAPQGGGAPCMPGVSAASTATAIDGAGPAVAEGRLYSPDGR